MRILGLLAILITVMLIPKITLANQTEENKKNIFESKLKNNILYIKDIPVGYSFPKIQKEEPPVIDPRDEKIIKTWKTKQAPQWSGLPKEQFVINASAYTAAADECGKTDGITASGLKVQDKRTLACPPQYPFGAKINIDGFGIFTCEDRGGAIKGNKFDIYVETKSEAFAFGRRNLNAQVVF
jgi:3D (Asp-Asp-Asp) domain-containing protein